MSAAHYKLDNLIAIVDVNNQQADGPSTADHGLRAAGRRSSRPSAGTCSASTATTSTPWSAAFDAARGHHRAASPAMIICDTMMGKGVPFLEEREKNHFIRVEPHEWQLALAGTRCREGQ